MAEKSTIPAISIIRESAEESKSRRLISKLRTFRSQEVVFAVVGYAGSGTSFVAHRLKAYLKKCYYQPFEIKARIVLDEYATTSGIRIPSTPLLPIKRTTQYQEIGDKLRETSGEYGSVAAYMIRRISKIRSKSHDCSKNVYILDSLKHPHEVDLLRHVLW